jgi:arylsulfatase A-like enzyme
MKAHRPLIPALPLLLAACAAAPAPRHRPPNVVLIVADDLGYGDLSCYGHPTIHTPHLDALAAGGLKLSQFRVVSPVCSPSRAALLTGCYPKRVGMHRHVVFPEHDHGLHTDEVTIADLLRAQGYATGCFGKWHLGHRPGLLPTDQGFDEFLGVPYSNDMAQFHRVEGNRYRFRLPLLHGTDLVEWEPDQHELTRRYTEAAIGFIEARRERPFFVYLPHSMPHIPIYASADFAGQSPRGSYGDVVEEIDDSVGRIVATLDRLDLLEDTLLIFTSDNGPWLQYRLDGGSAGLLRGGKGSNWEGGQRVPCILSWPGTVPAGTVSRAPTSAMDLFPTLAGLAGAGPRAGPPIDGRDLGPLLRRPAGAAPPDRPLLYYSSRGELAGVLRGGWKLLFGSATGGGDAATGDALYAIESDVGEQWDRAGEHPELAAELRALAAQLDAEIEAAARPTRSVPTQLFDPLRPDLRPARDG